MADGESKILRPQFGDPKVVVDRTEPYCAHEYVALMDRSRTVKCRVCGATIEAFEVLQKLARVWENCTYRAALANEIESRLEQLKVEERNAKARVRGVRKEAPEPKSALFYEELLRRLNAAETMKDIYDTNAWARGFKWLSSEQEAVIKDAYTRAQRRGQDAAGKQRRRRGIKVLDGGKGTGTDA